MDLDCAKPVQDIVLTDEEIESVGQAFLNTAKYQADRNTHHILAEVATSLTELYGRGNPSKAFNPHYIQAIHLGITARRHILLEFLLSLETSSQRLRGQSDLLHFALAEVDDHFITNGGYEKVQLLLAHGVPVNALDKQGHSALFQACMRRLPTVFELLVEHGANVMERLKKPHRAKTRRSLLDVLQDADADSDLDIHTASRCWGRMMVCLLQHGFVGTVRGECFAKYLSVACEDNNVDAVRVLLAQSVSGYQQHLGNALVPAAAAGHKHVVSMLLHAGADPQSPYFSLQQVDLYRRFRAQFSFTFQQAFPKEQTAVAHICDTPAFTRWGMPFLSSIQACEALYEAGISCEDEVKLLNKAASVGHQDLVIKLWEKGVRLHEFPVGAPPHILDYLATQGAEIDWKKAQSLATWEHDLTRLRKLVEEHGFLLRFDENFDSACTESPSDICAYNMPSYLALAQYLVRSFSQFPSPDHARFLESMLREAFEFPSLLSWILQEASQASCPGVQAGIWSKIEDLFFAYDPMKRDGDQIYSNADDLESKLVGLQILLEHCSPESRTSMARLWLTPEILSEALNKRNRQRRKRWMVRPVRHADVDSGKDIDQRPISDTHAIDTVPMCQGSDYSYDGLKGFNPLRILTLEPSDDPTSALIATLRSTTLSDGPQYEALSYVWGDMKQSQLIIESSSITIRHNLGQALRHLRFSDRPRSLWVDAVCINQADVHEKNQQVQSMRRIYQSASRVLVWLGGSNDDSDLIFEHKVRKRRWTSRHRTRSVTLSLRKQRAYDALLQRSWFYRTWVIQELALSRSAMVICGKHSASWEDVFGDMPVIESTARHESLRTIMRLQAEGAVRKPNELLRYSSLCEATDPRDKVYGLLGLLDYPSVQVDYDASIEEVFTTFARAILLEQQDLNLLHIWPTSPGSRTPTWVPGFGSTVRLETFSAGEHERQHTFEFDSDVLVAKGVRVDLVKDAAHTLTDIPGSTQYLDTMKGWEVLADTLRSYETPNRFLITLQAGEYVEHCRLDLPAFKYYERYGSGVLSARRADCWQDVDVLVRWRVKEELEAENFIAKPLNQVKKYCLGRRFFTTEHGAMGLAAHVQVGDMIIFLLGGSHPFVLRPIGQSFRLVGDCYLSGFKKEDFMSGENRPAEEFRIV